MTNALDDDEEEEGAGDGAGERTLRDCRLVT
jgi:hypothetical protein